MIKSLLIKIAGVASIALAVLSSVLYALYKGKAAAMDRYREKNAEIKLKQVQKAQNASEKAAEQGQQEVEHEVEKADSGDRSHFESKW